MDPLLKSNNNVKVDNKSIPVHLFPSNTSLVESYSKKGTVNPTKHYYQYGTRQIEYFVFRTKRKKTCEVIVDADEIVLRVPYSKPQIEIEKIVYEKISWIIRKQKEIVENHIKKQIPRPLYLEHTTLPYLGVNCPVEVNILLPKTEKKEKRSYNLNVNEDCDSVRLVDDKFLFDLVYYDDDIDTSRGIYNPLHDRQERIKKLYDEWIYKQGEKILKEKVDALKEIVKANPKKVLIKKLKDRWGSVTKNNSVNLNVNLVKAPEHVIDYVIYHELCHFKIKGHSSRFWNYLKQFIPEYKEKVEWLTLNGENILS